MSTAEQMTAVARERADKTIDKAIGELRAAALAIGKKHDIPEDIAGHSIEELLGRMAYIPSMARELRRSCGQELAKIELKRFLEDSTLKTRKADVISTADIKPATKVIPASEIPANIPVGMDVGDLHGVTVQAVKALRTAGLTKVGDVVVVPDAHLVKINGLGDKSVAMIRAAIARAASA